MIYLACALAGVAICLIVQIAIAYITIEEVNGGEDDYV